MSKFCTYCGKELNDTANFCTGCGASVNGGVNPNAQTTTDAYGFTQSNTTNDPNIVYDSNLLTASKILCVISCVAICYLIVPLLWMIPMTIAVFNRSKSNKKLSTGFKICVLLFLNGIAGILLLCDEKA